MSEDIIDEEKTLDLRDKLAIEILNGLLCGDTNYYSDGSGSVKGIASWVMNYHSSSDPNDRDAARNRAEKLIRTAYMMADVMRKVRLTAFE